MCSVSTLVAATQACAASYDSPGPSHRLLVRLPLVTVRELQKEARVQSASMKRYEKATYPQLSDVPVSETSVKIFGEAAWHSQPKNGTGVPPSYEPPPPLDAKWTKRRWDVDHILHFQQELGAASVDARLKATGSSLAAEKPVGARRVWPN